MFDSHGLRGLSTSSSPHPLQKTIEAPSTTVHTQPVFTARSLTEPLAEFTCFSSLSLEIQTLIWEIARPDPQEIRSALIFVINHDVDHPKAIIPSIKEYYLCGEVASNHPIYKQTDLYWQEQEPWKPENEKINRRLDAVIFANRNGRRIPFDSPLLGSALVKSTNEGNETKSVPNHRCVAYMAAERFVLMSLLHTCSLSRWAVLQVFRLDHGSVIPPLWKPHQDAVCFPCKDYPVDNIQMIYWFHLRRKTPPPSLSTLQQLAVGGLEMNKFLSVSVPDLNSIFDTYWLRNLPSLRSVKSLNNPPSMIARPRDIMEGLRLAPRLAGDDENIPFLEMPSRLLKQRYTGMLNCSTLRGVVPTITIFMLQDPRPHHPSRKYHAPYKPHGPPRYLTSLPDAKWDTWSERDPRHAQGLVSSMGAMNIGSL